MQDVCEVFQELKDAHADLVAKHDAYTVFLDDEERTEAEIWLDDCTREYVKFSMLVNVYIHETMIPVHMVKKTRMRKTK